MVKSKIIAMMAVMCLAFAGVVVAVADNNEPVAEGDKYIVATWDEAIDAAVAQGLFKGTVTYVATLDEEKLDSVLNYESYQLLKGANMIDGTKVVIPVSAESKYMDAAKKIVVDDTMKTVVKVVGSVDAAKEFFAAKTVDDLKKKVADSEKKVADLEAEIAALEDAATADAEKIAALELANATLALDKATLEKAVAEKDAIIAEKDKLIKEKNDKIDEQAKIIEDLQKEQPKVPFYETTAGQCAIILVVLVIGLLAYYNYDAIKAKLVALKGVKP